MCRTKIEVTYLYLERVPMFDILESSEAENHYFFSHQWLETASTILIYHWSLLTGCPELIVVLSKLTHRISNNPFFLYYLSICLLKKLNWTEPFFTNFRVRTPCSSAAYILLLLYLLSITKTVQVPTNYLLTFFKRIYYIVSMILHVFHRQHSLNLPKAVLSLSLLSFEKWPKKVSKMATILLHTTTSGWCYYILCEKKLDMTAPRQIPTILASLYCIFKCLFIVPYYIQSMFF